MLPVAGKRASASLLCRGGVWARVGGRARRARPQSCGVLPALCTGATCCTASVLRTMRAPIALVQYACRACALEEWTLSTAKALCTLLNQRGARTGARACACKRRL